MEPPKEKPEYPFIVAILAALCCLTLPLILGVGLTGFGFFTSPWVIVLGVVMVLAVLWLVYRRYKK